MKVAIDPGHGNNTAGKGVPAMKEHHFNSDVAAYAQELLEHNGFEVIMLQAPHNNIDIPLLQRTNTAIRHKVDMCFSIHADANANPLANGYWAFYWHNDARSRKLAELWDKVAQETFTHTRRGIRSSVPGTWTDFHMTREPSINNRHKFPSILIEHGFMTNKDDLSLLLTDKFRQQCAEVITKAACLYAKKDYKELESMEKASAWAIQAQEWVIKEKLSDGTRPKDNVTREEMWVMLNRLYNLLSK